MKYKNDVSAVLFPHTSLPEQALKRILPLFRPLRVFMPWHLEEPDFMKPYLDAETLRIDYPPKETEPPDEFFKILKAYRSWSLEHRDKGYVAFLKAQTGTDRSESSTWGIREELRRFGRETPPTKSPLFLKWHLILHLAREMEEQQQEADSILRDLKDKKSPLRGVLEGEDVESVFTDLPHFQADPMTGEFHWTQVIDAWVGLFGGRLAENEVLVTFDRHVFEFVSKEIDPSSFEGTAHPEPPLIFEIPDFSAHTLEEFDEYGEGGVDRGMRETTAKLFGDMGRTQEDSASEIKNLAMELQASFSRSLSQGAVRITAMRISPPGGRTSDQSHGVLSQLMSKSIVLFETVS